ncbi:putative bifunctional diguanylate cyclase/phosphodiesterase [Methylobacterium platani]|uniref:Diguanylate cyclase n=1 Tax=Methylobacterium platani TaxID=427683 RepID=A0A179S915_9HYPH|nr:EAL domain-containing protein [Methylobacterium platani]OAS23002.1 hypothetical protein A5481_17825 [Methylobacterium platani]
MHHLLAALLNHREPASLLLVALAAMAGGLLASLTLGGRTRAWPLWMRIGAFAASVTGTSWLAFTLALRGSFPQLTVAVPLTWMGPALALSFATAAAAGLLQLRGTRTARNGMLAGSVLSSGTSCMLFTAMAGLVRPCALSYDLTAVMIAMVLGAALWSFALWEGTGRGGRRRALLGTALVGVAVTILAVGSLAAILPLEEWLTAIARPDDLSTAPIFIIVAAEAGAVLVLSLFGSLVDNRVAARDRLEAARMRQLADSTFEGIVIHRDDRILDGNERLTALLGLDPSNLGEHRLSRFVDAEALALSVAAKAGLPIEATVTAVDGETLPVELLSRPISFGNEPAVVTALRDVRERKASEQRIYFMAHHDMLTELPNRAALGEHLDAALRAADRTGGSIGVLCLDLDGFKLVNDTLGHAAGDQLLRQVADRLRAACHAGDFVARIGGDEFVIVHRVEPGLEDSATALARRIIDGLTESFTLDSQIVSVGTSIGIARSPEHGGRGADLLKNADIALYKAKDDGRGWYCHFQVGMDEALGEQRALEQDLRSAIEGEELELHYQPLFDETRRLIAFEALVRWRHPVRGMISPADFIPLAERSGLIVGLGKWVLDTACQAAAAWPADCRIAVNLSPAQFLRGNLLSVIEGALATSGLAPERLELEITEGVLLDNTEKSMQILHAMRRLGVRLVLDDFGIGYSSLSYLHRFPLDKLKIDRSFVQRLEHEPRARVIVQAIMSMSRELALRVTAEGVETEAQFDILRAQGCRELQGFLLDRPANYAETVRLVTDFAGARASESPQDRQLHHLQRRLNVA